MLTPPLVSPLGSDGGGGGIAAAPSELGTATDASSRVEESGGPAAASSAGASAASSAGAAAASSAGAGADAPQREQSWGASTLSVALPTLSQSEREQEQLQDGEAEAKEQCE